jgi:hypothetical protein
MFWSGGVCIKATGDAGVSCAAVRAARVNARRKHHRRLSRNGRNTTAATDRLPEACDRRGTA